MKLRLGRHWAAYVCSVITAAIIIIDIRTPVGAIAACAYVAAVLVASFATWRKAVPAVALAASLFTVLGYFVTPENAAPSVAVAERAVALVLIWATAFAIQYWKRGKSAARVNDAPFRELFEGSDLGIQIGTAVKGRAYVNQACASLFGFDSPDELLVENGRSLIAERDRARVSAISKSLYAGERKSAIYEFEGLRKDGSLVPIEAYAKRTTWEGGPAVQRTFIDLTERKAAQETIQRNRRMLSGILSIAEEAIILADDTLRISLFSRGATRVFGYEADEAQGLSVEQLIPVRFRSIHRKFVEAFSAGPEKSLRMGARQEVTGIRKNGKEFPAAVSLSKLNTENGNLYSIILRDIGPENAARDELLVAKLAADAANKSKSVFLANMSHELRTPLNAIIGFSEAIQTQTLGPIGNARYGEYADSIHEAGKHLLNIINDILDLSKIEAGNVVLQEEAVSVPELIESCLLIVRERGQENGLRLEVDSPDVLPTLYADKRMLKQILINLLSNAIKFSPGPGTVSINTRWGPAMGFVFEITDTGIGIAQKDIPAILIPFKQVDSDLNRKFEGTGLGLPLSKSLVEMHGGSLELQSELGVGTTVTVRFPAARVVSRSAEHGASGTEDRMRDEATDDIEAPEKTRLDAVEGKVLNS